MGSSELSWDPWLCTEGRLWVQGQAWKSSRSGTTSADTTFFSPACAQGAPPPADTGRAGVRRLLLVWREMVLPCVCELTAVQLQCACPAAWADPSPPPPEVAHCPSLLSQGMGAGLAVVPLMGLLESIVVAKSFGRCPPHPLPPHLILEPHLPCLPPFLLAFI